MAQPGAGLLWRATLAAGGNRGGRRRQGSKACPDFTAGTCPGGSPGPLYPLCPLPYPPCPDLILFISSGFGVPPVRACKLRGPGCPLQLERAAQQIHKRVNISLRLDLPTGFSQCEGKEIVIWEITRISGEITIIWGQKGSEMLKTEKREIISEIKTRDPKTKKTEDGKLIWVLTEPDLNSNGLVSDGTRHPPHDQCASE